MNLTSMLVLTTMFINVSNSLPKTSYMKMVDAWLLFYLLYPFIVVLLHTYMDTLRNDEDREINHHGKTITIGELNEDEQNDGRTIQVPRKRLNFLNILERLNLKVKPANLVSVNEKVELEAQKEFYKKIEKKMEEKTTKRLETLRRINIIYLPFMALSFAVIFWLVGLKNAEMI